LYDYVCITTKQPDTKSNQNPNSIPNPISKQFAVKVTAKAKQLYSATSGTAASIALFVAG